MSRLFNLNGRKNSEMTTLGVLLRFVPECEEQQPGVVAPYRYKTFMNIWVYVLHIYRTSAYKWFLNKILLRWPFSAFTQMNISSITDT